MANERRADADIARPAPAYVRPEWLAEFENIMERPLRVLHVGNIANNAYINAKIMRKIGIHADIICGDYYHIMGTPEWESAEFKGDYGDAFFPDWWRSMRDYQRPAWFFQGPKRLCQETARAQFEAPANFAKQAATLRLATDYIAFRSSKLARPGGGLSVLARARRRLDFIAYLVRTALVHPSVGWNALTELLPFLKVLASIAQALFLLLALIATPFVNLFERIARSVSGRSFNLGANLNLEIATLKWRLMHLIRVSPLIPFGSRLFRTVTGRNFSEFAGISATDWLAGMKPARLRQVHFGSVDEKSGAAPEAEELPEGYAARYASETFKYLARIRSHVSWGSVHRDWHSQLDDKQYAEDVALALALAEGWEEVYAHYDVVQCYSTDGIVPMALGRKNYFAYEHGTLRSIPFEPTQIGRLTATCYRLSSKVMLTNLDNYLSCEKLRIAGPSIVPLPHALDDEKIHNFVASRPRLKPAYDEPPLFFSSSRQHWLDKDPNYAKGNDVFLRAAARVREAGHPMRIVLVEWGRDLDATKQLLSELKLAKSVTWVPTMTGEELWERYLQCHAVVDQFIIPAFGRVTFDSLTIGRRVISNLDVSLAQRFFGEPPPMLVASTVDEAERAILKVVTDPRDKAGIGRASADWARKYHSSQTILDLQLAAYRSTLGALVR